MPTRTEPQEMLTGLRAQLRALAGAFAPVSRAELREAASVALPLTLLSWAVARAGVALGERFLPPGQGYPRIPGLYPDLFRFDSIYYWTIARAGYVYDGNPAGNPNIVFSPGFPLLTRALATMPGLDLVTAGLLASKLMLFVGLATLFLVLRDWLPRRRAILVLAAFVTSAGSYSLNGYYSESTMLACLAFALLGLQRDRAALTAVASIALGLSRTAALPLTLSFAALLLLRAAAARGRRRWSLAVVAALCPAGVASYFAYIAARFGNPFELLPKIYASSWGLFHPKPDPLSLASGAYLAHYWALAVGKGLFTFLDISTLNLAWLTLALVSCAYALVAWKRHPLAIVFVPYALVIYGKVGASAYLNSSHRYLLFMLPIFVMVSAVPARLFARGREPAAAAVTAVLFAVNVAYGLLHAASFNQGIWPWF